MDDAPLSHNPPLEPMNFILAGGQFRPVEAQIILNGLNVGDFVELLAEPDNPYDSNAIAVIAKGEHIGYVPRTQTTQARQFMALSMGYRAEIVETVHPKRPKIIISEDSDDEILF
jgi:hypothetical protein